jgi:hypothetical protein
MKVFSKSRLQTLFPILALSLITGVAFQNCSQPNFDERMPASIPPTNSTLTSTGDTVSGGLGGYSDGQMPETGNSGSGSSARTYTLGAHANLSKPVASYFDREYYKENNLDVKACVDSGRCLAKPNAYGHIDPASIVQEGVTDGSWSHLQHFGYLEGRPGIRFFDPLQYALDYPDVGRSQAIMSGGELASWYNHYIMFGKAEGRKAVFRTFDEQFYLKQYPDVLKAVRNGQFKSGLHHFVTHGLYELRWPSHPNNYSRE